MLQQILQYVVVVPSNGLGNLKLLISFREYSVNNLGSEDKKTFVLLLLY